MHVTFLSSWNGVTSRRVTEAEVHGGTTFSEPMTATLPVAKLLLVIGLGAAAAGAPEAGSAPSANGAATAKRLSPGRSGDRKAPRQAPRSPKGCLDVTRGVRGAAFPETPVW